MQHLWVNVMHYRVNSVKEAESYLWKSFEKLRILQHLLKKSLIWNKTHLFEKGNVNAYLIT